MPTAACQMQPGWVVKHADSVQGSEVWCGVGMSLHHDDNWSDVAIAMSLNTG
jgi:hypothetical protein